jgi:hypothetical protein
MGQLNRGLEAGSERPVAEPAGQAPTQPPAAAAGQQTATVAQSRPQRPPLEAPHLGQLNRPLEPVDRRPAAGEPGWAAGQDESATPSGLLSAPSERPESPAVDQPDDEDGPSGLPHRTNQP